MMLGFVSQPNRHRTDAIGYVNRDMALPDPYQDGISSQTMRKSYYSDLAPAILAALQSIAG